MKKAITLFCIMMMGVGSMPVIQAQQHISWHAGAITRGDSTQQNLALVFTGDEYADGAAHILNTLKKHAVPASFFFTGRLYANKSAEGFIRQIKKQGHYLGAHSDQHLLYCDWNNRDSLLVTKNLFTYDLQANYEKMKRFGVEKKDARYFLPPYEWYNDSIAAWTKEMDLQLINFTHGTLSHADYTTPADNNYRDSETIYRSIINKEKISGLNGYILLMHIGTHELRTDKFYYRLNELITYLQSRGYNLVTVNQLLDEAAKR